MLFPLVSLLVKLYTNLELVCVCDLPVGCTVKVVLCSVSQEARQSDIQQLPGFDAKFKVLFTKVTNS